MERRCVLNSWSKEEVRAVIRYEWARGVSGAEIHNLIVKVSARWVPRQLTSTHQEQRMAISLEHLVRYHEDGNDFLFRIVTGDDTWVHHFTPESKAASMEWKHPSSPVRKKFKTTPSAAFENHTIEECPCNTKNSTTADEEVSESKVYIRSLIIFIIAVASAIFILILLLPFVIRHRKRLKESELPMITRTSISSLSCFPEKIEKECDLYCTNYIRREFSLKKSQNISSSRIEDFMSLKRRPNETIPDFLELNASAFRYKMCSLYDPSRNYSNRNVINEKEFLSTRL
ncbi:histone-lysine N-methyltransferase SETMAR [Trichonephila clavata]|uniref:Histone-lysine N-methyltransferase SETMAR n=1 Tax=Trichonephila clavata TaxID=2740835 RepID=A0A8X6FPH6_TRICU|nr:histone-lysine N-methyltransferase SETMAR [Trichonephila clavata]